MLDIQKIMDRYLAATSENEKSVIEARLLREFNNLSENEKAEVRILFLDNFDAKAKTSIENISIRIELAQLSQYVSLAYIAEQYFGKSRQWLNNKLKGNLCNGKRSYLSPEEIQKLSSALVEISDEIKTAALKIAS